MRQHKTKVGLHYAKMLFEDFFHGEQPTMFCALEGQPSTALVMFEFRCCGRGGSFWNGAVVSGGGVSSRSGCAAE